MVRTELDRAGLAPRNHGRWRKSMTYGHSWHRFCLKDRTPANGRLAGRGRIAPPASYGDKS